MKNQANKTIAEKFLSAYASHDWEEIGKLMHPDVTWTLPGEGKISGTAKGIDEVVNRVKTIVKSGVKTKLHHILIGQNGLTLSLNNTAVAEDCRILDEELATVLSIQDELVIKIDTYLSDVPMMERYFN